MHHLDTHIFKVIKIVDGHLVHQQNQISKIQNAKLCLFNHIPVRDADWFKCHFWQLYFKADWWEIHFLSTLSLPFYTFVLTSAERCCFYCTCAKKCSAAKSDENIIAEEKRSTKAAEKDTSATILVLLLLASVFLTGVTVVGSINATEFWQRQIWPPSFLRLLCRKMDLAIPQWSTLHPGSQMIYYHILIYLPFLRQLLLYLLTSLMCCIPSEKSQTKLRLFHGCSDKIKVGDGGKIKNCHKNGKYDWLFGDLMEAKITMKLRFSESEIRVGPFCNRESAKSTVKSWGVEGGGGETPDHPVPPLPDLFFCYAFERKWLKLKGLGIIFYV